MLIILLTWLTFITKKKYLYPHLPLFEGITKPQQSKLAKGKERTLSTLLHTLISNYKVKPLNASTAAVSSGHRRNISSRLLALQVVLMHLCLAGAQADECACRQNLPIINRFFMDKFKR